MDFDMGCHTWCYKLMDEQPSWVEVKTKLSKRYHDHVEMILNYVSKTHNQFELRYSDDLLSEVSEEDLLHDVKVTLKFIKLLNENKCVEAFCVRYALNSMSDIKYFKGKFYTGLGHKVKFRIGTYPPDVLTSVEECVNFIDTYSEKVYFTCGADRTEALLSIEQFFTEFPNGIIDFG